MILKKTDPVLAAAWILAIISVFFVKPDKNYLNYIDIRSLGILWGLMVIMQGFKENAVFEKIAGALLKRVNKGWHLAAVLIYMCFFGSMFITNDVALITFVPFAIMILHNCKRQDMMIQVVVLQTIAANLGSMLTPVGNPQNLYMYGLTGMSLSEFLAVMIPYSVVSFILLAACIIFIPDKNKELKSGESTVVVGNFGSKTQILIYGILFVLAFLTVLRILPFFVFVIAVFTVVGGMDYKILLRADYILLLTFIGFFIFTGNMARIDFISNWLKNLIEGKEFFVSIIASQFISNVPATLMLSGFTDNYRQLMTGVNVGGLGTLIASMASLISYKAYTKEYKENSAKYIKVFTIYNLVFLLFMVLLWFIAGRK